MNFSYWEVDFRLKNVDFAIIGGGIVGLSSAYHIKKRFPLSKVVVLERDFFSAGASSRNAGFACFGSPSELIADAQQYGWESTMQTLRFRREGLELLKEIIPLQKMQGSQNGGFEIFQKQDSELLQGVESHLSELCLHCSESLGYNPYEWGENHWGFNDVIKVAKINGEGMLHPGMMLGEWTKLCRDMGIDLIHGLEVKEVNMESGYVKVRDHEICPRNLVLCTNGLTPSLWAGLDVYPARNQVIVTEEILKEEWNVTFHQRAGYVYFRSVGKRILIGGGRDLFKDQEMTSAMEISDNVIEYLRNHLAQIMGLSEINIAYQWSGIMGLGNSKGPIIEKIGQNTYAAVRMGGMGVAIGTWVGKRLSEIIE